MFCRTALISQDPKTYVVWYLIKKSLHLFSWCNNQVSKPFGWKEAILKPSRQLHVNNRNIRKRCEICSKLTIKTPWRRSGVFIVHFEHISHLVLVFPLLTLSRKMSAGKVETFKILLPWFQENSFFASFFFNNA